MKQLEWGNFNKARIWIGDLPYKLEPSVILTDRKVACKQESFSQTMTSTVEVLIPTGGRAIYGLLGAEFHPNSGGVLHIMVESPAVHLQYNGSLARNVDEVYIGLTSEFAETVVNEASLLADGIGCGDLIFTGAYGHVGSTPRVFRFLTRTISRLLLMQGLPDLEDRFTNLLNSYYEES